MVDDTIARLNIEHLRNLLATEQDEGKRKKISNVWPRKSRNSLRRYAKSEPHRGKTLSISLSVVPPLTPVGRSDVNWLSGA